MKIRLISETEVEELISVKEVIGAVENAFQEKANDRVQMPPKSYIFFDRSNGDFRVMPAYSEKLDAAGVKIVNVHPQNPKKHDLPCVMATILLLDSETGAPLTIMNGTSITRARTGAAGAIAVKYLARKDSKTVAMIGAGAQARFQLIALNEVIKISEVRVEDVAPEKAKQYAKELSKKLKINIRPVDTTEEAVREADIVVTVTPRRSPLVMNEWISEGTHINAIGADAPGKQELDPRILTRAKIIVDDWEQASHGGEINTLVSEGKLNREDIYSDIGSIIDGKIDGRTSEKEITIFDSTGLAIQDIAVAWEVYNRAKEERVGEEIEL